MLQHAYFGSKGGLLPFAAICTNDRNAGLSCPSLQLFECLFSVLKDRGTVIRGPECSKF
jgi:hypothetical protein